MAKADFFPLFWQAWTSSFTESLILKAFEATGLSPPNPTWPTLPMARLLAPFAKPLSPAYTRLCCMGPSAGTGAALSLHAHSNLADQQQSALTSDGT
jgi:hypothetical protein